MTASIENVRRSEMNRIGDLTIAHGGMPLKAGNEVWLQAAEGHMGRFENGRKATRNIPVSVPA